LTGAVPAQAAISVLYQSAGCGCKRPRGQVANLQCQLLCLQSDIRHQLGGRTPWSAADPGRLLGNRIGLIWLGLDDPKKSGSGGTRADQGVRPTLNERK
jgi:hypothetical protein